MNESGHDDAAITQLLVLLFEETVIYWIKRKKNKIFFNLFHYFLMLSFLNVDTSF